MECIVMTSLKIIVLEQKKVLNTAGNVLGIKQFNRKADIIARIGGDEFVVLLTDLPNTDSMYKISSHLQDNIRKHNEQGNLNYELIMSSGSAYYDPEKPCSVSKLLNRADNAMYYNKKKE
jgi:diguanylate cyclase (GGDEF)-like protein